MTKIFLIGYMGSGKTTIGKLLARRLGWQFVDLDRFIESRYRKPIPEIFAEQGEEYFREIEWKALQEVAQFEQTVISTGGGTACFFDNIDRMNRAGTTIYLQVPVEGLVQRLQFAKQERPLIKNKTPEELRRFIADSLTKREPYYLRASLILPIEQTQPPSALDAMVEELIGRLCPDGNQGDC